MKHALFLIMAMAVCFGNLYGHMLSEAKRLSMQVIYYDDMDWPSGIAAHRFRKTNPRHVMKSLMRFLSSHVMKDANDTKVTEAELVLKPVTDMFWVGKRNENLVRPGY